MKITIDRFGTLVIAAENCLEDWALKKWLEDNKWVLGRKSIYFDGSGSPPLYLKEDEKQNIKDQLRAKYDSKRDY